MEESLNNDNHENRIVVHNRDENITHSRTRDKMSLV